tara:strand:+ start:142 stop:1302 length:1161 start_codon:yes stop_codon:yes gene_type:complete
MMDQQGVLTLINNLRKTMIGCAYLAMVLVAAFALISRTKVLAQVVDIGSITELNGVTRVVRDKPYESAIDFSLNAMDRLETAKGRMGVTFRDETTIRLTEHSNVIIDKFVFDPNPSKSSMALNFVKGTGRFISSKKPRIPKDNITIKTNSATIGIRGTDFTITVKETGESLIILLPDETGEASGEIIVYTALGEVILNKPYEATTVYNLESSPTPSVILDLTLNQIDNMLIVNPPQEKETGTDEGNTSSSANILDTDFLEFDELEQDALDAESELEYTELDIDYLATNFLEDLLDVIQEVDELSKASGSLGKQGVEGTSIGYDSNTQISSFVNDSEVKLIRQVQDKLELRVSKDASTAIRIDQEGKVNQVRVNGGTESYINIKQGT